MIKSIRTNNRRVKRKIWCVCVKKYDNKKRGRPSVSGFEFTFIKDIIDNTKRKKESTYDRLKRERDENLLLETFYFRTTVKKKVIPQQQENKKL